MIEQEEKLLSRGRFCSENFMVEGKGFYIPLYDWIASKYEEFYSITENVNGGEIAGYKGPLENSGDGDTAYVQLKEYIKRIKDKNLFLSFVDLVCYEDYQKEIIDMFSKNDSISKNLELLKVLGEEPKIQNNALYIIDALEELKEVATAKNISFRQITCSFMNEQVQKSKV
ncbi:hypothetical protein ACPA2L_28635 [Bacillus bombysepticus]